MGPFLTQTRCFRIIAAVLEGWLLGSFLILNFWPEFMRIRDSLLFFLILNGIALCARLFILMKYPRRGLSGYQETSATQEGVTTPPQKRLINTPLFWFVIVIAVMNTLLFLNYWNGSFKVPPVIPLAQMEVSPVLFSFMTLTICYLEQFQQRRDRTIRLTALYGITFLTLTYFLYLKNSLHHFWNQEQLLLFGLSMFGLASLIALDNPDN